MASIVAIVAIKDILLEKTPGNQQIRLCFLSLSSTAPVLSGQMPVPTLYSFQVAFLSIGNRRK